MKQPPAELVAAVRSKKLTPAIARQVLHYRGYFRAFDKYGDPVDDYEQRYRNGLPEPSGVDAIERVELTPRGKRLK